MTFYRASIRHNFAASAAPGVTDDETAGYSVGSRWFVSADAGEWVCTDATAGAAVWAVAVMADHPGYRASTYYATQSGSTSTATAVGAVDTLYLQPIRIMRPVTATSLQVRTQTGGAASAVKLAVWRNLSGGAIGLPILGSNTGAATTASTTTIPVAVTSTVLLPGWYWAGAVFTGTLPTMICLD